MSDLMAEGLRNFKKGDIITCEDGALWGKKIEVIGYLNDKLCGCLLDISTKVFFDSDRSLILLERPSLDHKVKDWVSIVSGNKADEKGVRGQVIVINPANVIMPYLVEYEEGSSLFLLPFVPKEYKEPVIQRKWCSKNQLKKSIN